MIVTIREGEAITMATTEQQNAPAAGEDSGLTVVDPGGVLSMTARITASET